MQETASVIGSFLYTYKAPFCRHAEPNFVFDRFPKEERLVIILSAYCCAPALILAPLST